MGPLLGALSFITFIVCLIALAFPFKGFKILDNRNKAGIGVGMSFALFVFALIITPSPAPEGEATDGAVAEASAEDEKAVAAPAKKPKSVIQKADSSIESVQYEPHNGTLIVRSHITSAWDDKGYYDVAAMVVNDVGKAFQKTEEEGHEAKNILFHFSTQVTDHLGVESKGHFMTVAFSGDDFRAANFDNLMFGRLMNLATEVSVRPVGKRGLIAWCDKNISDAQAFCVEGIGPHAAAYN